MFSSKKPRSEIVLLYLAFVASVINGLVIGFLWVGPALAELGAVL